MSTPHRSLNDRVLWLQVMDALKLRVTSQAIPSVTRCPLCKSGRLMILQDELAGGQWHWCQNCHSSGDMIELAAKTWGLGIPATVTKLTSLGAALPNDREVIRNYVQDQLKYRRRVSHMWKQARAGRFHDSVSVSRVAQILHLNSEAPRDRWLAGPGQIVGALSRLEVEEALLPTSLNRGKIFRENTKLKWEDVLAVPLYDLPGRPCAFLFAGRKARPDKDFIFYMLNVATSRGGFGEGGSRKW